MKEVNNIIDLSEEFKAGTTEIVLTPEKIGFWDWLLFGNNARSTVGDEVEINYCLFGEDNLKTPILFRLEADGNYYAYQYKDGKIVDGSKKSIEAIANYGYWGLYEDAKAGGEKIYPSKETITTTTTTTITTTTPTSSSVYDSPNTDWSVGDDENIIPDSETSFLELLNKEEKIEEIDFTTSPVEIGTTNTKHEEINKLIGELNSYLVEYPKIAAVIQKIYEVDASIDDTSGSSYNPSNNSTGNNANADNTTTNGDSNSTNNDTGNTATAESVLTTGTVTAISNAIDDVNANDTTTDPNSFFIDTTTDSDTTIVLDTTTDSDTTAKTEGDYGDIKMDKKRPLCDEDGNPLYDENGNPLYADENSSHTITNYKMDDDGRIYAYQIDGENWIYLEDGETFYLDGQLGYYIFDGNSDLNIYDVNRNAIGKLTKGNYAVFDVKYNDKNEVIAIETIIDGKKTWVYITDNGKTYGEFGLIGNIQNNNDGSKILSYAGKTIFGILGILLVAAGAYIVAKKLKDKDKLDDSSNDNTALKPGKYKFFDTRKDDEGNTTAVQIDKENDVWVETNNNSNGGKFFNNDLNNNNTNNVGGGRFNGGRFSNNANTTNNNFSVGPLVGIKAKDTSTSNINFGTIKLDCNKQLFDEYGKPVYDENGNPIYYYSGSIHNITNYKMDENGRIYIYQVDNKYWINLIDTEELYLEGQVGYYIFDGSYSVNTYDESGNQLSTLIKGNYAVFDVKYNDNKEVTSIEIAIDGKKVWINVTPDKFSYIGQVTDKEDSKIIMYIKKSINGILGILLVAVGAYITAKKLNSDDSDIEEKLEKGKYIIYDTKKDENGNITYIKIDKDEDLWVKVK